jgi:predicted HTH domain antitoxin
METITKAPRLKFTLWPVELDMSLQLGPWDTPDQVLSEAIEALLENHPSLRSQVAIELYCQDSVSLSRAAEIAGMDRWGFADLLRSRGIEIVAEPSTADEIREMLHNLKTPATL